MKSTKQLGAAQVQFGIRTKLFLLVFVSFTALMILIVWFVSKLSYQSAETTVNQTLTRSQRVLATRLQSRFATISETGQTLATDPGIQPRVYAGDSQTLQSRTSDLHEQYGFDVLIFANGKGEILARSDKPQAVGRSTAKSSLFRSALSGSAARGFMKRGSQLLQIVALPVRDNAAPDVIRGTLGIAYLLSEKLANEIQSLTGGEVAIFSLTASEGKNELTLSHSTFDQAFFPLDSYLNEHPDLLAELSKSGQLSVTRNLALGEEEFLGSFYPLLTHDKRVVGVVTILASKTMVLAPFRQIIKGCLGAGAFVLVLGSALSYFLSRGVTKPIIELVHITNRIRDGYFPHFTADKRRDEVGILQQAVFEMGQSLKKTAELEDYLASFVEEMEPTQSGSEEPTKVMSVESGEENSLPNVDLEQDGLMAGSLFDNRYRIEQLLGAGGMGLVYRAKDQELEEVVAIKLLQGSDITEEEEVLFKQEIKLARKISHNNIVRTYDFGNCENRYYISMEYAPGITLQQFINKNGPLDLGKGIIMARQICAALSAAHAQGVVHRDLKAGNIIISRRGVLKIMDFGIAVAVSPRIDTISGTGQGDSTYSPTSEFVRGTPRYMAPEQIRGRPQDQRVDIYASGVLLFHLFTAKFPFVGSNVFELVEKHIHQPPPKLRSIRKDLPELLEEIIDRALAKRPDERFETAVEMGQALSAV